MAVISNALVVDVINSYCKIGISDCSDSTHTFVNSVELSVEIFKYPELTGKTILPSVPAFDITNVSVLK